MLHNDLPPDLQKAYEILSRIDGGAMSAVYKVRHRQLDEPRVIKVIKADLREYADYRARFKREAKLSSLLRHQNIAQLYDFSVDEEGCGIIIMEFIEGRTLKEVLDRDGPLDIQLAVEIGSQALTAIGVLHRNDLLHRDIAADNMMLTKDLEGKPLVKLIDFGAARRLKEPLALTASGAFIGKMRYSAPESFRLSGSKKLDPRSDLYSFGVMLYLLLTGRYPISGEDAPSLVAAHCRAKPTSFEVSDPKKRIPGDLRRLILKALEKAPEKRFQSASHMRETLLLIQKRLDPPGPTPPALRYNLPASHHGTAHPAPPAGTQDATGQPAVRPKPSVSGLTASTVLYDDLPASHRGTPDPAPPAGTQDATARHAVRPKPSVSGPTASTVLYDLVASHHGTSHPAPPAGTQDATARHAVRPKPSVSGPTASTVLYNEIDNKPAKARSHSESGAGSGQGRPDPPHQPQVQHGARAGLVWMKWTIRSLKGLGIAVLAYLVGYLIQGFLLAPAQDVPVVSWDNSARPMAPTMAGGEADSLESPSEAVGSDVKGAESVPARPSHASVAPSGDDIAQDVSRSRLKEAESLLTGPILAEGRAISTLEDLSAEGHRVAQLFLAVILNEGLFGLGQDVGRARQLASEAIYEVRTQAELGDALAAFLLGAAFHQGLAVTANDQEAINFLTHACEGGNMNGCSTLGYVLAFGESQERERAIQVLNPTCEAGALDACHSLGVLYMVGGDGVAPDHRKALVYYMRACAGGDAQGCNSLAVMYVARDRGTAADEAESSLRLLTQNCDRGERGSCRNLAMIYDQGEGVPEDNERAAKLYSRACNLGELTACASAGAMFSTGDGVGHDGRKARDLYTRSCEGGVIVACYGLGEMYDKGRGVPKNPARALALYERACEGRVPLGCNNIGVMYQTGNGLPQDDLAALEYFERACHLRNDHGCKNLSSLAESLMIQCDRGHAASCAHLGLQHLVGRGVVLDQQRAVELLRQACEARYLRGCTDLGVLYFKGDTVPQDTQKAESFLKESCYNGGLSGCAYLGILYARDDLANNDDTAKTLLEDTCAEGAVPACGALGEMYAEGVGGAEDYHRARALLEQACDSRDLRACVQLALVLQEQADADGGDSGILTLYRLACEGGDMTGCNYLGAAHAVRNLTGQDQLLSLLRFRQACEGGSAVGCKNLLLMSQIATTGCTNGDLRSCETLGHMYAEGITVPQDDKEAISLFEQSCAGGHVEACVDIGVMYAMDRGSVTRGPTARELFAQACEEHNLSGCFNLAKTYVGRAILKDDERAATLLTQACGSGHLRSCSQLGVMYSRGIGVELDLQRAVRLFKKACDGQVASSCSNLGLLYAAGQGLPQDWQRATELFSEACDGGDDGGCDNLRGLRTAGSVPYFGTFSEPSYQFE